MDEDERLMRVERLLDAITKEVAESVGTADVNVGIEVYERAGDWLALLQEITQLRLATQAKEES